MKENKSTIFGDWEYKKLNKNSCEIVKYKQKATKLKIPTQIDGLNVTKIACYAFHSCSTLSEIELPNTIKSIGEDAFKYCSALQNIILPNTIESISDGVFGYCSALQNITLPDTIESIGNYTFYECKSLTNINLPNTIKTIGKGAFKYCSALTKVELPKAVQSIGDDAFYDCCLLREVKIPNTVQFIGDRAFYCCSALKEVEIPDSIKIIDKGAFEDCISLTKINIPKSIDFISLNTFKGCQMLKYNEAEIVNDGILKYLFTCEKSYCVPDKINKIADNAFWFCEQLKTIILHSNVELLNNSLAGCKTLEKIIITEGTHKINNQALALGNIKEVEFYNQHAVKIIDKSMYQYILAKDDNITFSYKDLAKGFREIALEENEFEVCMNLLNHHIDEIKEDISEVANFAIKYAVQHSDSATLNTIFSMNLILKIDFDYLLEQANKIGNTEIIYIILKQTKNPNNIKQTIIRDETVAEKASRKYIKARFENGKTNKYFCDFKIKKGDKVFVEGKLAGKAGEVIEILDDTKSCPITQDALKVTKAYNVTLIDIDEELEL